MKLTQQIELYKNKVAFYEGKDTQQSVAAESTDIDSKLFDRFESHILNSKDGTDCWMGIIANSIALYGPFGSEKLKILDKSFDWFVENILAGSNLKLAFYANEQKLPKTYKEFESYAKLK